ncbi:hypothetical protein HELRODRAFT_88016, partial [Helobdella robusta]|uniref:protein-serine/threonine phosphatase n=1 Tax=Helobdella robusta TaxID=6412 RepID=T1G6X4_HELRO
KSLSESYLTVKGAALILSQTECPRSTTTETHAGDIQLHLQAMLYLLRAQDKLKLAVKLESRSNNNNNNNSSSSESTMILGIDIKDSKATIGLVLPIYGDCTLQLDGDGGITISTNGKLHNFKPLSVQAMWAALQCLTKARDAASHFKHFASTNNSSSSSINLGHIHSTWSKHYLARITSEPSSLSEWHCTVDTTPQHDFCSLSFATTSAGVLMNSQLENVIRLKLKQIMMTVDLEEVTSKYLRTRLEEEMSMSLLEWRRFIDDEMIIIMRQMDAPSEILPFLFLGSEWNASNLDELHANNVRYILNVTREIANFYPETFEYVNVRVFDDDHVDLLIHWESTYKFISKARDHNCRVLVHCKMGVSRSASTVIAYVMKERNMSAAEATKFVRSRRSCIQPNPGFKRQLETYEGILDARFVGLAVLFFCFSIFHLSKFVNNFHSGIFLPQSIHQSIISPINKSTNHSINQAMQP